VGVVGVGAADHVIILSAKDVDACRDIAMAAHAVRQVVARQFGATGIVEERGEEGIARIKELTNGYSAHSTIEAVGTQESMQQAIGATRHGGHDGFVGISNGVEIDGTDLFVATVNLLGGPAPVRR